MIALRVLSSLEDSNKEELISLSVEQPKEFLHIMEWSQYTLLEIKLSFKKT